MGQRKVLLLHQRHQTKQARSGAEGRHPAEGFGSRIVKRLEQSSGRVSQPCDRQAWWVGCAEMQGVLKFLLLFVSSESFF